jgi:hypothetical protein
LKPPKSAQTLKKRSGMAESVSNQGFARKKSYNGISRFCKKSIACLRYKKKAQPQLRTKKRTSTGFDTHDGDLPCTTPRKQIDHFDAA